MGKTTKAKAKSNKIKCAFCGKPFVPKTANARYCGGKCKAAVKNAKKRAVRAAKQTAKKDAKKTAIKVASVQKVKLPKPPPKSINPHEAKCSYDAQRDRFMLIGMSLTLLVKSLLASCENVKATCKHIKVSKIPLKKAK